MKRIWIIFFAKPQVGDYRIKFEVVEPTDASIIAMQQGETFGAYRAQSGESLYMLSAGIVPAQQMFQAAEEGNATTTWILRFVGWLLMLTGFRMILGPLQTLLDVVPFLGSIAGVGISFAAGVVAFALSLVTIALAWLYYRPVLTIILIAIAVGAFVGAKYLKKQAPQKAAA